MPVILFSSHSLPGLSVHIFNRPEAIRLKDASPRENAAPKGIGVNSPGGTRGQGSLLDEEDK